MSWVRTKEGPKIVTEILSYNHDIGEGLINKSLAHWLVCNVILTDSA